jgi:hypothetical protein
LVGRIEAALAAAAPPPGMRPIPTLMWQGGGMVPGRDTLMHDLMTRVGLSNFSADKGCASRICCRLKRWWPIRPACCWWWRARGRMGIMTGCCRILCWGISPEWLVCGLIPILNFAAVRRLSVRWRRLRPHVMGYRVAGRRGAGQFRRSNAEQGNAERGNVGQGKEGAMKRLNLSLAFALVVAFALSLLAGRVWIDPLEPVIPGRNLSCCNCACRAGFWR